jgi:hypothetical protein
MYWLGLGEISASEADPDVIALGSICLAECISHRAIAEASMGTAVTSKPCANN